MRATVSTPPTLTDFGIGPPGECRTFGILVMGVGGGAGCWARTYRMNELAELLLTPEDFCTACAAWRIMFLSSLDLSTTHSSMFGERRQDDSFSLATLRNAS